MSTRTVERDERTIAVENASYRWSYHALSFGLLAIVAFRAFARGESSWDLLGLVVLGGVLNAAYQATQGILTPRWARLGVGTFLVAALVALGLVLLGVWR
jgi:hypothetical protein